MVDVRKLSHHDDIKKDMYGKWLHSGSHSDVFICSYCQEDEVNIELPLEVMETTSTIQDPYTVFTQVKKNSGGFLALLSGMC